MISSTRAGCGARVPECVPLPAWLEDQVAGCAEHHLVAEQNADIACEHESELVFSGVPMQRGGQFRGGIGCSTSENVAAGVTGIDHETNAHRTELTDLPLLGFENAH